MHRAILAGVSPKAEAIGAWPAVALLAAKLAEDEASFGSLHN
jgi:hypothetical protein